MVTRKSRKYQPKPFRSFDLERELVNKISDTGREQIKRRRKAGLSVFYLKEGRVVEVKPDKTEIKGKAVKSKWITLDKSKRSFVLK